MPFNVHIRWMIRRDMPEVLAIEQESFEFAWSEEDFIRCLRERHNIGMVAELDDAIVAFMVYELHKTRLHLVNLAVAVGYRRRAIGAAMLAKLQGKLSPERRRRITLEIRETNLAAQLFLRERPAAVLRRHARRCLPVPLHLVTPSPCHRFSFGRGTR